jgi:hypothetical protein
MKFSSWLDALKAGPSRRPIRRTEPRSPRRQSAGGKLLVEHLEDRTVPAFVGPVDYGVGASPQAVVSGYFNNDAILDLAVANYSSPGTVSVLIGNAGGTFQDAIDSETGGHPLSLVVGDFNEDGFDDVATVNASGVSVLLGIGDGTFSAPSTIDFAGLGSSPASVAVGDFNADGDMDLVVTSNVYNPGGLYYYYGYGYYYGPGYYTGSANVLLGNGAGDFSGPNTTDLGRGYHTGATVGDFDAGGKDDFATINLDYYSVSVLLNDGAGTLLSPSGYYIGDYSLSVAAGDVDNDGDDDLVTANFYGSSVGVLLSNGSGSFGTVRTYAAGTNPRSVALAHLNGDDMIDIVTSSNNYSSSTGTYTGQVNALLGYGDGTFANPIGQALDAGSYAFGLTVGDFDGVGGQDVAVTNYVLSFPSTTGQVSVLLNAGDWVLPAKLTINDVTVTEGDGGTLEATFTVTRSGNLDETVTVNYSTANGGALSGSDYVAQSGTLTFAPGQTTQIITILVNGDLTDEYDQGFYVNLSAATNANLTDSQGFGNILDNDPPPTITITNVSAKEGNGNGNGNGKNNNGTTTFHFIVTLSAASEKQVWVNFATANGTATTADNDYVAKSGTLSFSPGDTSETISVAVKGDKRKESNETFVVNLSAPTNATIVLAQGIGTIQDDDTRGNG